MTAKTTRKNLSPWQRALLFGALSFAWLLCAIGLLVLILWKAELLVRLGLVGNFHYVVLVLLGLCVAGYLVSSMESYAAYTGKVFGGTLKLRGGVVVAALVVVGGFWLPKPVEAFAVTVFVHGEAGPHDWVLRNVGTVWMTLGPDPRQERIGNKGQAEFKNIPANFRGQEVPVSVEAEGFEMTSPNSNYRLSGPSLDVVIRRKAVHLAGRLQDTEGHPVTNATIRVGDVQARVDVDGHFSLTLADLREPGEVSADVMAPGFKPWHGRFTPNAGEATIQLQQDP